MVCLAPTAAGLGGLTDCSRGELLLLRSEQGGAGIFCSRLSGVGDDALLAELVCLVVSTTEFL